MDGLYRLNNTILTIDVVHSLFVLICMPKSCADRSDLIVRYLSIVCSSFVFLTLSAVAFLDNTGNPMEFSTSMVFFSIV